MSFFKVSIRYVLAISMIYSPLSAIKIRNIHHAVDVAGKQRMFTQRMLKDYTMIGMGKSFGEPKEDLKDIIEKFENHLQSLYVYTDDPNIKMMANEISEIWLPIKRVLESEPKKERVGKLQEQLEELLKASDRLTVMLANSTNDPYSGEIINISGRQRMLSQRMASLYMLKVWGVNDNKFKEKMENTMELFRTSLKKLQQSKLNTKEINQLLNKVEKSFMFFEVMNRSSKTFIPTLISKKSNDILKNMNSITRQYVLLTKK